MKTLLFYQALNLMSGLWSRRAAYTLARQASRWAYRHNHAVREATMANLRVVLKSRGSTWSESELEQIVRRSFENFGKYMVDFFQIGSLSDEALNEMITLERIDYLEQCRDMGRGIIGLTAHVGNWELGSNVLDRKRYRVNAVVLQQPSKRLNALFQSQRNRRGVHVLPLGNAAALVPACLRHNEVVVLLADQDFSGRAPHVPFFGQPARLPRGPAVLAARNQAPILPVFVLRQPDDTFLFRAYPPILPERGRSVEDIQHSICSVLETVIRDHPDQWFAFKPLW